MPDAAAPEYITKTEAARIYRRSERSISRDITNAVKFGDRRVLQHVQLRLENGTRRPGSELTIDEIVKLRDGGLNPTWFIDTVWLKQVYGRRDEPAPSSPRPTEAETPAETPAELPPITGDLNQQTAVLAAQNEALRQSNADLRSQAERLEKELDRRAEERREENELQRQNNVLMQQIYAMLEKMQESAGTVNVLPPPRSEPSAGGVAMTVEPAVSTRKGSKAKKKPAASDVAPKRSKRRGRVKASPPAPKPAASTMSKYLPTIDKAVRSLFRK